MIDAVIFDMDGVLIDSEPLHYRTDLTLLGKLGIQIERDYLDRFVGMNNPEMWKTIISEQGITRDVDDILFEQLELKLQLLNDGDWTALSGAVELVEGLVVKEIPVAVASSSSLPFIEGVLRKTGLDRFIHRYVSAESVARGKPAPDVFLEAARMLAVSPVQCLVVEDSRNGVLAAKAAGMRVIGYRNPSSGDQDLSRADAVVTDHRDTMRELERLGGGFQ
ncbi:MAG: HAD family phosphatase [Treponema sp.]|nr:HAD family phosphatase [Treponema sp.]